MPTEIAQQGVVSCQNSLNSVENGKLGPMKSSSQEKAGRGSVKKSQLISVQDSDRAIEREKHSWFSDHSIVHENGPAPSTFCVRGNSANQESEAAPSKITAGSVKSPIVDYQNEEQRCVAARHGKVADENGKEGQNGSQPSPGVEVTDGTMIARVEPMPVTRSTVQRVEMSRSQPDENVNLYSSSMTVNEHEVHTVMHPMNVPITSLQQVEREKARLEGQVEALQSEARVALRERAQLHAQLATLTEQLKHVESCSNNLEGDKSALNADLETLRSHRQRLEMVVMDAQKLIEEKDLDLKMLHEDLCLAQATVRKLQECMQELKDEISRRDNSVRDLKSKITELYVQYETTQQNKLLVEGELSSLQNEMKSSSSIKDWYQSQLRQVQEGKTRLQDQLTRSQSESIAQATNMERLHAENSRLRQQMTEAQTTMLREKEILARTLEAIEADMLERETAFAELHAEKVRLETSVVSKMGVTQQDQASIEELNFQNNKLKNQVRRNEAQINILQHEQSGLVKKVTMGQENLLQRDRDIDRLNEKVVEVELELKEAKILINKRDEELSASNLQREGLRVQTESLEREKAAFDKVLIDLKGDMSKVGRSFSLLQGQLAERDEELEQLHIVKNSLERELNALRDEDSLSGSAKDSQVESDLCKALERCDHLTKELKAKHTEVDELKGQLVQHAEAQRQRLPQAAKETPLVLAKSVSLQEKAGDVRQRLSMSSMEGSIHEDEQSSLSNDDRVASSERMLNEIKEQLLLKGDELSQRNAEIKRKQGELQHLEETCRLLSRQASSMEVSVHQQKSHLEQQLAAGEPNATVLKLSRPCCDSQSQTDAVESCQSVEEVGLEIALLKGEMSLLERNHQYKLKRMQETNESFIETVKAEHDKRLEQVSEKLHAVEQLHIDEQAQWAKEQQDTLAGHAQEIMIVTTELEKQLDEEQRKSGARMQSYEEKLAELTKRIEQKNQELSEKYEAKLMAASKTLESEKLAHSSHLSEQHQTLMAATEVRYAQNLSELKEKLEQRLVDAKDAANAELESVRSSYESQLNHMNDKLNKLEASRHKNADRYAALEAIHNDKMKEKGMEIEKLTLNIINLNQEINVFKKTVHVLQSQENSEQLALDLERERGKLAGFLQSHSTLKQHTESLEAALASHESNVAILSSHADQELQNKEQEFKAVSIELEQLKRESLQESERLKVEREALVNEKEAHQKTRRQMEALWLDNDQLKTELSRLTVHSDSASEQILQLKSGKLEHSSQHEKHQAVAQTKQVALDRLARQLEEAQMHEDLLKDNLQTTAFERDQLARETSALKEQIVSIEQRFSAELASMQQALQSHINELSSSRGELAMMRQEKSSLQIHVNQLKNALKTTVQFIKEELENLNLDLNRSKVFVRLDLTEIEKLLSSSTMKKIESRPLSFIQATLSGLRGEISCLQKQVDEHTATVQNSSQVWENLELQVADLREVCRTSAAGRAASLAQTTKIFRQEVLVQDGVTGKVSVVSSSEHKEMSETSDSKNGAATQV